jgi:dipeptidyl-peptidase III
VSREQVLAGQQDATKATSTDGTDVLLYYCQPCAITTTTPKVVPPPPDMTVHTIPLDTPVVALDATKAFELLTPHEQAYAYALGKADWEGAKICLFQCSVESVPIFCLLQLVYSAQPILELLEAASAAPQSLTENEIAQAILYSAAFYGNLGNYKSFGDTKFIPALGAERMYAFVSSSKADPTKVLELWDECSERMYSLPPRQRQMGLGSEKGISTYFSANCDASDAKLANAFLDSIGVSAYNTRLFKTGNHQYTIRLASSTTEAYDAGPVQHDYEGYSFTLARGDYAPIMARVVSAIQEAIPYVANPTQQQMLEHYAQSFTGGSIDAHKDASRHWIRDKGPAVESYIGFIESYRDPSGVRGEWEGFVSCVNKEVSRKFQALVDHAESFLTLMPWPKELEKDVFLRPDFTSLDVLSFGSSGVPAGINIPNYDEIRQSEGFKNVSLGNVLQASYSVALDQKVSFLVDQDQDLYKTLKGTAFEVQVGIHELLGHGSGKLYHRGTPDAEHLVQSGMLHPLTGQPITGPFYASGATWGSTFGKIAPTYEECRAECTGLYLCLVPKVLSVFGLEQGNDALAEEEYKSSSISDVSYVNWLLMARAGLTGLEFYTPETKEWRQAHMQARYVILRLLLEAESETGKKLLSLNQMIGSNGQPDVEVVLDRSLISTVGRKTVGDFLLKLQVYKSLGDVETGTAWYNSYSKVPESMIQLRDIVMARKEPRKLLIQPHMHKMSSTSSTSTSGDDKIQLQTFPCTPTGMIESFVARFPEEDPELLALYKADKEAMTD